MILSKLMAFKENEAQLSAYINGMSLLWQSGVLDILRDNGRVGPVSPDSPNYVAYQAALANWSVGFNLALDQLIYFREIFIEPDRSKEKIPMDFGGLDAAVEKGDLTQEEADAVRAE
jgi:hypothetical protein